MRVWATVRLGQQQSGSALYCSKVHSRDKKYSARRRHCHWTDCIQASAVNAPKPWLHSAADQSPDASPRLPWAMGRASISAAS